MPTTKKQPLPVKGAVVCIFSLIGVVRNRNCIAYLYTPGFISRAFS
jgi:hypothetical protein